MKPVQKGERLIAYVYTDTFKPLLNTRGEDIGQSVLQLNNEMPDGVGFHAYKMAPGMTTQSHVHTSQVCAIRCSTV